MKKLYLGIDVGGTKIRGVLWDGRRVAAALEVATPRTRRAFIARVSSLIARLSRKAGHHIRGVGFGVAGAIRATYVVSSRNIPYLRDFNLHTVRLPSSIPIRVDNDARSFARAEAEFGAGRRARRMLAFTIGTGIGRAYAVRSRVQNSKRFEHAEPWERDYQHIRDRGDTSELAVFLGEKLSRIVRQYRPDIIVLGGGILSRRGFTKRLTAALRGRGTKAKIYRSRLGPNAAAIGAALLFLFQR